MKPFCGLLLLIISIFHPRFLPLACAACEGLQGAELSLCQEAESKKSPVSEEDQRRRAEMVEMTCNGKKIMAIRGELEDKKKGATLADLTGICEIWGASGQCKGERHEISCQNGKVEGVVRLLYPDGKVHFEGTFAADIPIEWITRSEDGSPDSSIKYYATDHFVGCEWKAGSLIGRWEYLGEKPHGYWLETEAGGGLKETYYNQGRRLSDIPDEEIARDCY